MSLDVRIDRCTDENAWYKNHVGEVFVCQSAIMFGGVFISDYTMEEIVRYKLPAPKFIPFEDCTILNVTRQPPYTQEVKPFKCLPSK